MSAQSLCKHNCLLPNQATRGVGSVWPKEEPLGPDSTDFVTILQGKTYTNACYASV